MATPSIRTANARGGTARRSSTTRGVPGAIIRSSRRRNLFVTTCTCHVHGCCLRKGVSERTAISLSLNETVHLLEQALMGHGDMTNDAMTQAGSLRYAVAVVKWSNFIFHQRVAQDNCEISETHDHWLMTSPQSLFGKLLHELLLLLLLLILLLVFNTQSLHQNFGATQSHQPARTENVSGQSLWWDRLAVNCGQQVLYAYAALNLHHCVRPCDKSKQCMLCTVSWPIPHSVALSYDSSLYASLRINFISKNACHATKQAWLKELPAIFLNAWNGTPLKSIGAPANPDASQLARWAGTSCASMSSCNTKAVWTFPKQVWLSESTLIERKSNLNWTWTLSLEQTKC